MYIINALICLHNKKSKVIQNWSKLTYIFMCVYKMLKSKLVVSLLLCYMLQFSTTIHISYIIVVKRKTSIELYVIIQNGVRFNST